MKVKRYDIKKNTSRKDLEKAGALSDGGIMVIMHYVTIGNTDYRISLAFGDFEKTKVKSWDDIEFTSIYDTDADKPYKTWKTFQESGDDIPEEGVVNQLVAEYNSLMDSLQFMKAKR